MMTKDRLNKILDDIEMGVLGTLSRPMSKNDYKTIRQSLDELRREFLGPQASVTPPDEQSVEDLVGE